MKIKVAEVTSGFENQEDATMPVTVVQSKPKKIKTREEYLAEKKAKLEKEKSKELNNNEAALEVTDESVTDTNTDTSLLNYFKQ